MQHVKKVIQKDAVKLGIKQRLWKIRDKSYWSQFGITKKILEKYNPRAVINFAAETHVDRSIENPEISPFGVSFHVPQDHFSNLSGSKIGISQLIALHSIILPQQSCHQMESQYIVLPEKFHALFRQLKRNPHFLPNQVPY